MTTISGKDDNRQDGKRLLFKTKLKAEENPVVQCFEGSMLFGKKRLPEEVNIQVGSKVVLKARKQNQKIRFRRIYRSQAGSKQRC